MTGQPHKERFAKGDAHNARDVAFTPEFVVVPFLQRGLTGTRLVRRVVDETARNHTTCQPSQAHNAMPRTHVVLRVIVVLPPPSRLMALTTPRSTRIVASEPKSIPDRHDCPSNCT